jgi:hypothetical protein
MRKIITVAPRRIPFGLHLNLATRPARVIIPTAYSPAGLLKRRRQVYIFGYALLLYTFFSSGKKLWLWLLLYVLMRTGSVVVFEVARRGHTQNAYYVRRASCGGSSGGPAARFFLRAGAPRPNSEPDWHVWKPKWTPLPESWLLVISFTSGLLGNMRLKMKGFFYIKVKARLQHKTLLWSCFENFASRLYA